MYCPQIFWRIILELIDYCYVIQRKLTTLIFNVKIDISVNLWVASSRFFALMTFQIVAGKKVAIMMSRSWKNAVLGTFWKVGKELFWIVKCSSFVNYFTFWKWRTSFRDYSGFLLHLVHFVRINVSVHLWVASSRFFALVTFQLVAGKKVAIDNIKVMEGHCVLGTFWKVGKEAFWIVMCRSFVNYFSEPLYSGEWMKYFIREVLGLSTSSSSSISSTSSSSFCSLLQLTKTISIVCKPTHLYNQGCT